MEIVQVRYRCTACSALVTLVYPYLASILATTVTRHASGEPEDFKGDYVALVCERCRDMDADVVKKLEAGDSPQAIDETDQMTALEADRLGIPYP